MKAYESFSAWEKEESNTNTLTKTVSKYIQSLVPELETVVKWGQGCFLYNGKPTLFIHTEPDHVQLGFFSGVTLADPNKFLEGKGKYVRHIKIVTKKDLQRKDVDVFISQAVSKLL